MSRHLRPAALCLLGGAALALCLPKPGLCALAWAAWAPILLSLDGAATPRRAAVFGWLAGTAYFALSLHWIYLTCRFAGVPVPASVAAWAALAAFEALPWALFGWLARRHVSALSASRRPWVWAALWTAVAFAGERWTPRITVDLMEYTQWRWLSMLQGASWAGPHGLGFLILAFNGALAEAWRELRSEHGSASGRRVAALAAAACALVLAWWGWGEWALSGRPDPPPHPTLSRSAGEGWGEGKGVVAVLQPAIDQYEKWDETYAARIRGRFDVLLDSAAAVAPSLVVWPETSVPGWLEDPANLNWVAGWARRVRAPMLVGTLTRVDGRERNSVAWFDPGGGVSGVYHKRRLVPFGEFVPLRPLFEPFIGILSQMGDLHAGSKTQAPFPLGAAAAVLVCYEAVSPTLARDGPAQGASVLVNLTNDGWYKNTWGPHQHFQASVFRAIENRVTVVRAANTGISGVVDPYGVVAAELGLGIDGVLTAPLPAVDPFPSRSPYARWGDWLGWLSLGVWAALSLFGKRKAAPH